MSIFKKLALWCFYPENVKKTEEKEKKIYIPASEVFLRVSPDFATEIEKELFSEIYVGQK